jgi:hypothetical protein
MAECQEVEKEEQNSICLLILLITVWMIHCFVSF